MSEDVKKAIKRLSDLVKDSKDELAKHPEMVSKIEELLEKAPRDHDEDDYSGDEDGDDDAAKWLKEQESPKAKPEIGQTAPTQEKRKSNYTEWAPGTYSPAQKAAIDKLTLDGYSPREAERMAGAYKGPKTFEQALHHTVKPSMPSDKHLGELKGLAGEWLDNHDRHEKRTAEAERNPMKFAAGKMLDAHEDRTKDYHKAYSEHLNSPEVKDLKGLARHKAVQAWKEKYRQENPELDSNISNVSEAQKNYKEAGDARKRTLDDILDHVTRGGVSMPAESSYQEAAQSIGGEKSEDSGYVTSTHSDPAASFAGNNKQFTEHLANVRKLANKDQLDRMQRVDTAKTAAAAAPVIRRRAAKPEGTE